MNGPSPIIRQRAAGSIRRPGSVAPAVACATLLLALVAANAWGCEHDRDHPDAAVRALASTAAADAIFRVGAGAPAIFTDVTTPAMLQPLWGEGVAWADYDGDRDLDLLVSNEGQQLQLFRNDGGGVLTPATPAGLGAVGNWTGVAWADYDNDGDLDVYAAEAERPHHLFRNNGSGSFTDVTSGDLVDSVHTHGVSWADYDLDGDLDFAYANAFTGDRLMRNDGGGVFTRVTPAPLDDPQYGRGIAWADYDRDGDPDLCVANFGTTRLFRNDGGTLVDVTNPAMALYGHAGGVAWGDFDNDLDLDLFIPKAYSATNRLYRNDDGVFVDVTPALLAPVQNCIGAQWGDFDNDADLDLYVSNLDGPNYLFRNEGSGAFTDANTAATADTHATVGVAWADYDEDGDLDLYMANNRGQPDRFLRNDEPHSHHWLQLDLRGTISNRSAIGTMVEVTTGSVRQLRVVDGGSGYNSQNTLRLHFGLGAATAIDTLRIRWPSGLVQTMTHPAIDRIMSFTEGGVTAVDPWTSIDFTLRAPEPNPSAGDVAFRFELPDPAPVRVSILDVQGRVIHLHPREIVGAGRHERRWDGRDASGRSVAPGLYFVRVDVPGGSRLARIVRL